eukprot:350244-Rhodomonas_salina.2
MSLSTNTAAISKTNGPCTANTATRTISASLVSASFDNQRVSDSPRDGAGVHPPTIAGRCAPAQRPLAASAMAGFGQESSATRTRTVSPATRLSMPLPWWNSWAI